MTREASREVGQARIPGGAPVRSMRRRGVRVNTRVYQATYGKLPDGLRPWGFAIGARTGSYWVDPMPFPEAEGLVRRMAESLGEDTIMVLP